MRITEVKVMNIRNKNDINILDLPDENVTCYFQ